MIIPFFTYDRLRIQTNMYECDRFLIKRRNDVVGIKIQLMQEIFMNRASAIDWIQISQYIT